VSLRLVTGFAQRDYNPSVEFRIRDYHPRDFSALWRLDQDCFPAGIAYSRMELMHYIGRPHAFTLVAEATGENGTTGTIAGFIVAERDRRHFGHVITIDVREQARRTGLGSQLMAAAEQRLRSDGCTVIYLEAAVNNHAALAFYKRRGYSMLSTIPRYYNGELDALVLGKRL
jgi:ribosomal-protein-alanine N-acetyltransferase